MTRKYNKSFWGTAEERFWRNVDKTASPVLCWNWTGRKMTSGYGLMKDSQKQFGTHRFSYRLHIGNIPKGMYVCHSCDNKLCVNPTHLWLGTPKQNTQDMIEKGRNVSKGLKGEDNPKAKLTYKQVEKIRKLYSTGKYPSRRLGKMYGVTKTTILYIIKGKIWKS